MQQHSSQHKLTAQRTLTTDEVKSQHKAVNAQKLLHLTDSQD